MISLQDYLYTSSLLRVVTFKLLLLNRYVLIPTVLPTLETLFELLMQNSFQRRHIFFLVVFNVLKASSF